MTSDEKLGLLWLCVPSYLMRTYLPGSSRLDCSTMRTSTSCDSDNITWRWRLCPPHTVSLAIPGTRSLIIARTYTYSDNTRLKHLRTRLPLSRRQITRVCVLTLGWPLWPHDLDSRPDLRTKNEFRCSRTQKLRAHTGHTDTPFAPVTLTLTRWPLYMNST